MLSPSILNQGKLSEDQFIADLTSLFRRRNISFGQPEDLEQLATHLASDDAFRGGLFNLCTVISHMSEVDLTPQQLLVLVARASGGQGIFDAEGQPVIPHDTETAFLTGYEAYSNREPDLDAYLDRRNHEPFHAAMALATAEGFHETPGHPAGSPSTPRAIPSNAPIDSLTLGELRQYLDELERRVSRIEPRLDSTQSGHIQPELRIVSGHALVEGNAEVEPAHGIFVPPQPTRIESTFARPALTGFAIIPAESEQPPLLLHRKSSGRAADSSLSESDERAAANAARFGRLQIANRLLVILLVISAIFAVFVAVRYLNSHPINLAVAPETPSAPSVEIVPESNPIPSEPTPATPAPHTPQFTGSILLPPQVPKKPSADEAPPDAIVFPTSVAPPEIKPPAPAPIIRQAPEPEPAAPAPAQVASPPPASPSAEATSVARPEQRIETPPARPAPTPAPPQVAEARPVAPTPAPATPPRSIPTAQPPTGPVSVPSSRMIGYAIASPAPSPPRNWHSILDSTVEVTATISKEGNVVNVRALSGPNDVRPAALDAMKAWRFKPYIVNGQPVEVVTTLKFLFKAQ